MIEFTGKQPKVNISSEYADYLRTVAIQVKGTTSLFLNFSMKENTRVVSGIYIPKQHVNEYHDIIEPEELSLLGTKYNGICLCGEKIVGPVVKEDIPFVQKTFYGIKKYTILKATRRGEIYGAVVEGNYIFYDIPGIIIYPYSKEMEQMVKDDLAKGVDEWVYNKHGYDASVRDDYTTPKIVSEKLGWRDVV